ncbi:MAG: GIY-YIG nuclease family protein [Patescibacteria group bacterium]|nr:GIY-YIG nuclease family protein [Patescibacteria group bacterium]MBU1160767.1 GIY-YIG nuclease family protein [Patescibacteria group bacterium]MBU1349577.1 GIY-YIG nuclease family protein [Patescibacteria group bacterium]MBU1421103.1 GIY-YIG nuclease family protein [Patescibacteria group bacterium]MBU1684037.1 GIY-YIG nuclease family protein [Patescibacteria group bacterium]
MPKQYNEKHYYIYIGTNKTNKVLYTGVTNNLLNRDNQHKTKFNNNSFTAKYNINKIVYYEVYTCIRKAIAREKQIKAGSRKKKIELINSINLAWNDLVSKYC